MADDGSTLTPLHAALLATKHEAAQIGESALVAYWLDGRAEVSMGQHIGWLVQAYDRLGPHVEALRQFVPGNFSMAEEVA